MAQDTLLKRRWRLYIASLLFAVLPATLVFCAARNQHTLRSSSLRSKSEIARARNPATLLRFAISQENPRVQPATLSGVSPSPKKLRADTAIQPGHDAGMIAKSLAMASGESVIVILPQAATLQATLKPLAHDDQINWKDFQLALRRSGAISVTFNNSNTLGIVQGRSYCKQDPPPNCYRRKLWQNFQAAYQKLTAEEQQALASPDGLVVPGDLNQLSQGLRDLIAISPITVKPSTPPVRLQLRLEPFISTNFPDAPRKLISGFWSWSGYEPGGQLKFPDTLIFPSTHAYVWEDRHLELSPGIVKPERLLEELSRLSGVKIKVEPSVEWPSIGVAGGAVTAGQLLDCLNSASVVEARFLPTQKLLYLTTPLGVDRFLERIAITKEEWPQYVALVNGANQAWGVDEGPLPYGLLRLPTRMLPFSWTIPLLSGYTPTRAFQQIGMVEDTIITQQKMELAAKKWLQQYANCSVSSTVGFTLLVIKEKKAIEGDLWTPQVSESTVINPLC